MCLHARPLGPTGRDGAASAWPGVAAWRLPGRGLARKIPQYAVDVYDASVCRQGGRTSSWTDTRHGLSGSLRPLELGLVARINALAQRASRIFLSGYPVRPFGLTGRPCPVAVRAHATVTFEGEGPALSCRKPRRTGRLHIRPIGIPAMVRRASRFYQMITKPLPELFGSRSGVARGPPGHF